MTYKFPSAKGFRRQTRLENAAVKAEQSDTIIRGLVNVLGVYSDPKNWQPTDETRDVTNEAGLVVGVERLHRWVGPGEGSGLAVMALKRAFGIPEPKPTNPTEEK